MCGWLAFVASCVLHLLLWCEGGLVRCGCRPLAPTPLQAAHTMVLAAAATRGHRSAHSLATGPVIAEPAGGGGGGQQGRRGHALVVGQWLRRLPSGVQSPDAARRSCTSRPCRHPAARCRQLLRCSTPPASACAPCLLPNSTCCLPARPAAASVSAFCRSPRSLFASPLPPFLPSLQPRTPLPSATCPLLAHPSSPPWC